MFLNGQFPASFSFIFIFSNILNVFLQPINVHTVYGAGIQTHDRQSMSLLPEPLDPTHVSTRLPLHSAIFAVT